MDAFWELKFGVEVSARYHDWRRATLSRYLSVVRLVSICGSIIAVLAVTRWFESFGVTVDETTVVFGLLVALVNIVDLTFHFDDRALRHQELYVRFKKLQEDIARHQAQREELMPTWEGEAQSIRRDEPPTFWAVYALCWNQTIDRYRLEHRAYFRKIGPMKSLLRNFVKWSPLSFPAVDASR